MIRSSSFFSFLKKNDINFFCGVPDSTLKANDYYLSKLKKNKNIITHNEGGSIATAIGYYLSTKRIAAVYLQNSGLGNTINPIASIADENVYSIPMILIIGWRGSPMDSRGDEPQHKLKGKITKNILALLKIKHCVINSEKDLKKLKELIKYSKSKKRVVACLIRRGILVSEHKSHKKRLNSKHSFSRGKIISYITSLNLKNLKIFSTTGYTSRELYQIRKANKSKIKDFLNVGGMGHTSSIAHGYAINSKKNVLCFDGDGSLIMHMGSMAVNGQYVAKNFKHIVFNNKQHESVGGQKTPTENINFKMLSKGCGYKKYFFAKDFKSFKKKFKKFYTSPGSSFFEIIVDPGTFENLIRPNDLKKIVKDF